MAKKVTKKVAKKETGKAVSAQALLKQLETETDQLEKRKIRAKLRKMGHSGGLGATGKKSKKVAKKAGKKAKGSKKATVEDDDE